MSPQHIAQVIRTKKFKDGMICKNNADTAQLLWNEGKNTLIVLISRYNNCFTFRLAPGFKNFMAYCAKLNDDKSLLASATLIEDDEEEVSRTRQPIPRIPRVEKEKNPYSIYTPTNHGKGIC